jgi:hypothetical protein
MTYELLICFFIGFVVGALTNRNKDDREQQTLYERQIKAHEETIQYYKNLCKWHVERKQNGNKES